MKLSLARTVAGTTYEAAAVVDIADLNGADQLQQVWLRLRAALDQAAQEMKHTPVLAGGSAQPPASAKPTTSASEPSNGSSLSQKQRGYLLSLISKRGEKLSDLNKRIRTLLGDPAATINSLDKTLASALIDELKAQAA